jgi:hypothetical protein
MAKLITKNTDGHFTITPSVEKFNNISRNTVRIENFEFELTEDEVKTLVFFWQDEYSDKLKKANERIKELEYCIKTIRSIDARP